MRLDFENKRTLSDSVFPTLQNALLPLADAIDYADFRNSNLISKNEPQLLATILTKIAAL